MSDTCSVASFVPHRLPMLLVDTILEHQGDAGVVAARVADECIFVDENGLLDEVVCVELLAQAYAAIKGFEAAREESGTAGMGFLTAVRQVKMLLPVNLGDELRVIVRTAGTFEAFAVVEGEIMRDADLVATGSLKVWAPQGTQGE